MSFQLCSSSTHSPGKHACERNRIHGEVASLFQVKAAVGSIRMGICEGGIEVMFVKKEGGKWRGRADVRGVIVARMTERRTEMVVWIVGMVGAVRWVVEADLDCYCCALRTANDADLSRPSSGVDMFVSNRILSIRAWLEVICWPACSLIN